MQCPTKSSEQEQRALHRILTVDDHPLIRRGVADLISSQSSLIVCGEAATHEAGRAEIASSRPDLVIADLSLGDGDGLAMIRDIRSGYPNLPILVFTMHATPLYAEQAFRAGANGYVAKLEMSETRLTAIRRVLSGERFVSG